LNLLPCGTIAVKVVVEGLSANPEPSGDLRLLVAGVNATSGVGQVFNAGRKLTRLTSESPV
jgi:hypothetical protein